MLSKEKEGKRRKGRPPMSYIENLTEASGLDSLQQLIEDSRDRKEWRKLVTPAMEKGKGIGLILYVIGLILC